MQVSVETTSGLERQMTVTVPAEKIDQDVNKQVQQQARTRRMDGFRPGKVPAKVIKRMFGDSIRYDVLNRVVQESFFQAVQQEKLKPAGTPNIDLKNDKEGEDLQFVATFEVYPEVELADYSSAEITRETAEIKDEDVDQMIDTLRKQQSEWSEVKRGAKEGDRLNLDFEGFIDGEAFEGGKAENYDLVLGSNSMIPGFEDALIGLRSAKAPKEITVTFPEDYQAENLAGKEATFKITIHSVNEPQLPELNEEFFSKFGLGEGDEASFRTEVRKNMERELTNTLKMKVKDQVFGELIKLNQIDVPAAMIDDEIDQLRRQAVQQFGGASANIDPNTLPKEMFEEQAKRRVTIGLLVQGFIESNKIEVDEERVQSTIKEMADTYQEPSQVIEWYNNNQQAMNQVRNMVLEDQVVDQLLASAKVTDVEVSYEDAMKPAQPNEEEATEE